MLSIIKQYIYLSLLYVFQLYLTFIKFILKIFGPIKIIYHIGEDKITNITLFYYLNINNKYNNGIYYCKIYSTNRTNHLIYTGKISDIDKIVLYDKKHKLTRKNIILMNNNKVVNCDLNILDNYFINLNYIYLNHNDLYDKKFLKMKFILYCLGIKCTDINFIYLQPFRQELLKIDKVTIDQIINIE